MLAKIRNLFAVVSVAAVSSIVPVVVAGPAQADQRDCIDYVDRYYEAGPKTAHACSHGSATGFVLCYGEFSPQMFQHRLHHLLAIALRLELDRFAESDGTVRLTKARPLS